MADFEAAVTKTLIHEGGSRITDDPDDRGGLTKYGISQRSYPNVDIRNLTEQQAKDIYKRDYWDKVKGDDINSQEIAENLFDTAVNMGPKAASRLAQMALELEPVDGIIGPKSLAAINTKDEELFIAEFTIAKIARYAYICNKNRSQSKYLLGWVNRALGGVA
ncbi:MAG: N-acetylmuramidase [Gammaproteobacteria bacterium]|nr:N-acetylmuramidase [Gammaproteobacteria bacterium]